MSVVVYEKLQEQNSVLRVYYITATVDYVIILDLTMSFSHAADAGKQ